MVMQRREYALINVDCIQLTNNEDEKESKGKNSTVKSPGKKSKVKIQTQDEEEEKQSSVTSSTTETTSVVQVKEQKAPVVVSSKLFTHQATYGDCLVSYEAFVQELGDW